jgi:hypothetical protein
VLKRLGAWLRRHKTLASAVCIALVIGVPAVVATVHQGFPAEDVSLQSRDVWVTNGDGLLVGRLNHQIDELDAAASSASKDIDVLQNGGAYFLVDSTNGTLERIDQQYATLTDRVMIPAGAKVAYGGDTIAIVAPSGKVWVLDASARLAFDPSKTKPTASVGAHADVTVSDAGTAFIVAPTRKQLITVSHPGSAPSSSPFTVSKPYQVTAVGDTAVVLDENGHRVRTAHGTAVSLPHKGLRLQQPSASNDRVLVAAGGVLMTVPLNGGAVESISSGGGATLSDPTAVSAPVWLNGCSYAAWAGTARYLYACDDDRAQSQHIEQSVRGDDLRFRVNHGVIALNSVRNGDVWTVSSDMQLVRNWETLRPDDTTTESDDGQEKPVVQSYEDTLAQRSAQNREPTAAADGFGVRPGRSTILPVLDNDTDPDGDVLTIADVTPIPDAQGILDVIDGGRALQLTTTADTTGGVSFRYTVDDGRGGRSSAQVVATVHLPSTENAPVPTRASTATIEAGQTVSYNVLDDWIDPDGDDLTVVSAATSSGDTVSLTPDGTVTYENTTSQTGSKTVEVTVSDGRKSAKGELDITVKPAGSLPPVATPDFATAEPGEAIVIDPIANDRSPSGQPLGLVGAALDEGSSGVVEADNETGTISFTAQTAGEYYLRYTLGAGSKTVAGLIRVDVAAPSKDAPPIAVADVAYVRAGQPTAVQVLDNDISPAERVLVVQSVAKALDSESQSLNVEVLDNSIVKITAPSTLTSQVQLTYTISDGRHTAQAGVVVVPAAPVVTHQPPIAVDDSAIVRVGDIVSVPVLDNDYSPDDEPFQLDSALADASQAGPDATAFVSGSMVRYQAPVKPGQYSVDYRLSDEFGQHAVGTLTFHVTALDKAHNRVPGPQQITVRAFAGSAIPVTVPLSQIDPDGDSVQFTGIGSDPRLGRIVKTTSTTFTYEAYPGSSGTDEFTYKVTDALGAKAVGAVRVGVIPRPATASPPVAVNDRVEVKPGKTASVQALTNDSDPNGFVISVLKKLGRVDAGLTASVHRSLVVVQAPQKQGTYLARYTITNGQGGQASAVIQVVVTDKAKEQPPTAVDHVIDKAKGRSTLSVDALAGAYNPSGLASQLKVSVTGQGAKQAHVQDGDVIVALSDKRTTVAYRVTDQQTGLSGGAFIIVPPRPAKAAKADDPANVQNRTPKASPTPEPTKNTPKPSATPRQTSTPKPTQEPKTTPPPHLKSGLAPQFVDMNGSRSWSLSDIVTVPSGRAATIVSGATGTGGSASGTNEKSISFTAKKDFRGPATVTFTVDDGKEEGAKSDRLTKLTFQLTVGREDQSDVAPTFTTYTMTVGASDAAQTIDLRSSTYHPNDAVLKKITYTGLKNPSSDIKAALSGSKLTVSAGTTAKPTKSAIKLTFTLDSGSITVPGTVLVNVVSSTKPKAVQKASPSTNTMRGKTVTLDAVAAKYWDNPFSTSLKIVGAKLSSAPKSVPQPTFTTSTLSLSVPSGSATGTATITYTVQDATKDSTRNVTGTATVVIHDKPSTPGTPAISGSGDGYVSISFKAPADNGKNITQYRVEALKGGSVAKTMTTGTNLSAKIDGLTNGTAYTFKVQAYNADGWSAYSAASASRTPYGKPSTPSSAQISSSGHAPATLTLSWGKSSSTGGGSYRYEYKLNSGGWTSAGTKLSVAVKNKAAGNYSFQVRTYNAGSNSYSSARASNTITVTNPPPTVSVAKGGTSAYVAGHIICIKFSDFASGTYKLTALYNGNAFSSQGTVSVHLSGAGHYCLTGTVNNAVSGWDIAVKITGALTKTPSVSGATWNSMSSTGWGVGLNN